MYICFPQMPSDTRAPQRTVKSSSAPAIGIGITTHNRHAMLRNTLVEVRRFAPEGARIVVVDDASDVPVKEATFRFEKNVGIARAKNKCFELLEDFDHIFLFDDDTHPLSTDWWRPYVASPESHLQYMFEHLATGRKLDDATLIYSDGSITAWSHGRGSMLYFKRRCLEVVGGMDPAFGKWGFEHVELSGRIYNAGLTSFKFMDVVHGRGLFWAADEHEAVTTTAPLAERLTCLKRNREIWMQRKYSSHYVPYRESAVCPASEDVIITCYFTSHLDPERGVIWETDYCQLGPLIRSMKGQKIVILHDCLNEPDTETVSHVKVSTSLVAYWQKWVSLYQYLIQHPDIGRVFCVDATDVEMLRNPFPEMDDLLYSGDEPSRMDDAWMRCKHPAASVQLFIRQYAEYPLLNCGLLGGRRELVIRFIGAMLDAWGENIADVKFGRDLTVGHTEMGLYNLVMMTRFASRLSHGRHVNTVFKQNEYNNVSWWKHK